MTDETELSEAEKAVRKVSEELARLRRDLEDCAPTALKRQNLQDVEKQLGKLIENRNALFRDVAGNDY